MIQLVDGAERFVASKCSGQPPMLVAKAVPAAEELERRAAEVMPALRGVLADEVESPFGLGPPWNRVVARWRCDPELVAWSTHPDAAEVVEARGRSHRTT